MFSQELSDVHCYSEINTCNCSRVHSLPNNVLCSNKHFGSNVSSHYTKHRIFVQKYSQDRRESIIRSTVGNLPDLGLPIVR